MLTGSCGASPAQRLLARLLGQHLLLVVRVLNLVLAGLK
jgi:hypothetical protein